MCASQAEPQRPKRPAEGFIPNPKFRLQEQCRQVMRFKHFSFRTEEAYWDWMKRFILFHGKRHPREMGEAEVTAFLTHLAAERDVAASTRNQALSAGEKEEINRRVVLYTCRSYGVWEEREDVGAQRAR